MSDLIKEDLLEIVLKSLSRPGDKVPDRLAIERKVDQFLAAFGHLVRDRDWIISQALGILVTSIGVAQELVNPRDYVEWLEAHDKAGWRSWPWLHLYLRDQLRRPSAVISELDRSTDRVLDLIGDPNREGLWDRRGLVVGHVQSGKTEHYISLAAKAIDSGYKLIVILSGIHENLRQQTQERIDECIIGKDSCNRFEPFGVQKFSQSYKGTDAPLQLPPDISTLTSFAGDFGAVVNQQVDVALGEFPVVLVVKKNVSILRNVLAKIRGRGFPYSALRCATLVIDDEADHSSVNTANTDPETDPTRINELIRKILWSCDRVAFVGYTATPYANIFMGDSWVEKPSQREVDDIGSDLFPRDFIVNLDAPSNYIGPSVVFGHDGDDALGIAERAPLPMHINVTDADSWLPVKHKSTHTVSGQIPLSLASALRCFVLSIAARSAIDQDTAHCSMLIHVTRFIAVQDQVMSQVKAYLESLQVALERAANREDRWNELHSDWLQTFVEPFNQFNDHPSQRLEPPILPAWEDVRLRVIASLNRIRYSAVNNTSKETLDFRGNSKTGLVVVAVGGDRLSRGLTLEGLSVSYFLRGARAYDTLMQMGRWFGYRRGFAHLCRVYSAQSIVDNFRTITLATEELRREFSRMAFLKRTPSDYGLRVREPRADLLVTALNKMRRGATVKVHFAESLISSLDLPEDALDNNLLAFNTLVLGVERHLGPPSPDQNGNHKWEGVAWELISPFLLEYTACSNVCLTREAGKSLLYTYVESVQRFGDLKEWTVVVVGRKNGDLVNPNAPFRLVGRQRLMDPNVPGQALHKNRVTFKGVAMGQDEGLDLNQEERRRAMEGGGQFSAAAYRAARPSSRGLMLLYPIHPTAADNSPWTGPTVIGLALSLPSSKYDKGHDYVCTALKIREMLGHDWSDDLSRDAEEGVG